MAKGRARQNGGGQGRVDKAWQGEKKQNRHKGKWVNRAFEQHRMHMSNGKYATGFIYYCHPFLGFL